MGNREILDRVLEDDGLVAGLPPRAAAVVRGWCLSQVRDVIEHWGTDCAADWADQLVARVRTITDVVTSLPHEGPTPTLLCRLDCVVADRLSAWAELDSNGPLEQRLQSLLALVMRPALPDAA